MFQKSNKNFWDFFATFITMKTFLQEIIPKIKQYSKKLDNLSILTDKNWICLDELLNTKSTVIFRSNRQLIISQNGIVEKGEWDYINNSSLLLETKTISFLLKFEFIDEYFIALKRDSSDNFLVFINESKFDFEINNLSDLKRNLEQRYSMFLNGPKTFQITIGGQKIEYKIQEEKLITQWFGSNIIESNIAFNNGKNGKIYFIQDENIFYYEDWIGTKIYNVNFEVLLKQMLQENKLI